MQDAPKPTDFAHKTEYRDARKKWAAAMAKAGEDDGMDGVLKSLTERVKNLEEVVSRTDEVTLESGTYTFTTVDHLSLSLAAVAASRGVSAPLILSNGQVIPNVRMSEIVSIATQLIERRSSESEPQDGSV